MDILDVERALAAAEVRPILVDARVLRRVIKRHRRLPGFGPEVPHARCYALSRDALLAIASPGDLGVPSSDLGLEVILLPRPEAEVLERTPPAEVLSELWRYAFHARIHLEIERAAAAGRLSPARLRERVHRVGQTEFDEIRLVLRQDDLLLPPRDDLETYAEFAALYLELSRFAPGLVGETFPTLRAALVEEVLAEDLDVPRLLAACRPRGAPDEPPGLRVETADRDRRAPGASAPPPARDLAAAAAPGDGPGLREVADDARRRGNLVRSALSRLRIGDEAAARADVAALVARLAAAVGASPAGIDAAAWEELLLALARRAAAERGVFRWIEARVLFDLQRACLASERAIGKVDVVEWALSLGRRPVVRLLPATRPIRVDRQLAAAARKVPRVGLPEAQRARLGQLLAVARRLADDNTRALLRPPVLAALHDVGLRPEGVPERVAAHKLVEELLDQATTRGYLGLGALRDALSKNQLKLADVDGARELFGGDALLRADHRLSHDLDGVHRRGEIYLRGLQKVSSLFFGTRPGRFLTRYLILPFGAAAVLLFGVELVVNELGHELHLLGHHRHLHFFTPERFLVLSVVFFALLHSARARDAAHVALRALTAALSAVFVAAPRWILSRPLVRAVLDSRAVLFLRRFLLKPALFAGAAVILSPARRAGATPQLVTAAATFGVVNLAINSRAGALAEEIVLDAAARTLRRLRRQVLPGLLRLVLDFFRRVTDGVERGIYAVDEWLRFQEGQSKVALFFKAVLGTIWFAVAYVVRVWVNLLMEPTVNPIKHFPWVTVAAKILLPFTKSLTLGVRGFLTRTVGALLANPLTGLTVPFLSGFFGFLAWELKENYKLYRATRALTLGPVPIGHHGETMGGLLRPGLHSGTLPKAWAKHRRAARKGDGAREKHEETLREIREAVERFVEREMLALIHESPAWSGGRLHVAEVELGSNRVRVALGPHGAAPLVVSFEEQSGLLVAGVPSAGFSASLGPRDRVILENALSGLYHLAGVDLVRQQVEATLGDAPYDVADEGLVVWPGGFGTELVYDLEARGELRARVRGEPPASPPPPLDRRRVLYREQPIAWAAWVAAWGAPEPERILAGASLLPPG